jgi:hypothetical protein
MSQKIQIRRGTDAERRTVVFSDGEPVFTQDTKKFYVGDGITSGGIGIVIHPPLTSTSSGISGQLAVGGSFLYACTGNNRWGRVTLSPF